jgi:hypothetical protein
MIGKLIGWLVNDIIVHNLAHSKRFQALALRIDASFNHGKKTITENYVKTGEKVVKEHLEKVKESHVGAFAKEFVAEIKQDLNTTLSKVKNASEVKQMSKK